MAQIIRRLFEFAFGDKASVRAVQIEEGLKTVAAVAKDVIVVKSGLVLLGNMVSNIMVMKVAGVSWHDIWRAHKDAIAGVQAYQKDAKRLQEMEHTLKARRLSPAARSALMVKRDLLQDKISRNPVTDLMEEGMLPTIVDDVTIDETGFSMKNKLDTLFDEYTAKLPKPLESAVRVMAMTHDTKLYQGMSYLTQVSDFIGRYAMYHHLTKNKKTSREEAINQAMQTFVNYDLPTHPVLQYLNDIGMLWFTKYFFRTQMVILQQVKSNPGGVLFVQMLDKLFGGGVSYIGDSFFLFGGLLYRVHDPLDSIEALNNVMTLKAAEDILGY